MCRLYPRVYYVVHVADLSCIERYIGLGNCPPEQPTKLDIAHIDS